IAHVQGSSAKLIQPLDNPEQLFRSSRKLTRTLSVDYLNLSDFNTSLEEKFKEEETTDRNGYIKNHKKTVKKRPNTDTRTEEFARAGSQSQKVNLGQLSFNSVKP
ncbi:hypothetical protein Tco_1421778, partial [Tanacetum coccineum]